MTTRPQYSMSSQDLAEANLTRAQMIGRLGKMGLSVKLIDGCTDRALAELWRVLRERGRFAEGQPDVSRFSESQKSDLSRVRQYISEHAEELRRVGSDPAEMLAVFTNALANGYRAADLIGKG